MDSHNSRAHLVILYFFALLIHGTCPSFIPVLVLASLFDGLHFMRKNTRILWEKTKTKSKPEYSGKKKQKEKTDSTFFDLETMLSTFQLLCGILSATTTRRYLNVKPFLSTCFKPFWKISGVLCSPPASLKRHPGGRF